MGGHDSRMPPLTGHTPDPLWPLFAEILRRNRYVAFRMVDRMPDAPGIRSGAMAMTNKHTGDVYLRSDLDDGQLRACTGHELHHLRHPGWSEIDVEHSTAQLLVPLPAALAARTEEDMDDMAQALWVDRKLIMSRLAVAADEIRQREAS